MPTARIPVEHLRIVAPTEADKEREFLRQYAEHLIARGFRIKKTERGRYTDWAADPPIKRERSATHLILSQDVPGRVTDSHKLPWYLQRIARGDVSAIADLHGFLLGENDDRAATLATLSADMASDATGSTGALYADSGMTADSVDSDRVVTAEAVAGGRLCELVLLLMGAREEAL